MPQRMRLWILMGTTFGATLASAQINWSWRSLRPPNGSPPNTIARSTTDAVQVGYRAVAGAPVQAVAWSGTGASVVSLPVGDGGNSAAQATNGSIHGGWINFSSKHAVIWEGAERYVDLHPFQSTPSTSSEVYGVGGDMQVGEVFAQGSGRAALWRGSAASFVQLSPEGEAATAFATDGVQQVGLVGIRATLWSGTPGSQVDLHPGGSSASYAIAVADGVQAGYLTGQASKACLWRGSAESFMDLHPAGYSSSVALSTTGEYQAGYARQGTPHAMLWRGTASAIVDLHALLTGYTESQANSIYERDGALYIAGSATNTTTGQQDAVLWVGQPVPEPLGAGVFGVAIFLLRRNAKQATFAWRRRKDTKRKRSAPLASRQRDTDEAATPNEASFR